MGLSCKLSLKPIIDSLKYSGDTSDLIVMNPYLFCRCASLTATYETRHKEPAEIHQNKWQKVGIL